MRHVVCLTLLFIACLFWYPYLQQEIPAQKEIKAYSRHALTEVENLLEWAHASIGSAATSSSTTPSKSTTTPTKSRDDGSNSHPLKVDAVIPFGELQSCLHHANSTVGSVWKHVTTALGRYPLREAVPFPLVYGPFVIANIEGVENSALREARFDGVANMWILVADVPARVTIMRRETHRGGGGGDANATTASIVARLHVAIGAEAPLSVHHVVVDSITSRDHGELDEFAAVLDRDRFRLGIFVHAFLNDYLFYIPFQMLWQRLWTLLT